MAIKGPIVEPRLDRTPPELEPGDGNPAVVQVGNGRGEFPQKPLGLLWLLLKEEVVIAGDEHLGRMGLAFEPSQKLRNLMGKALVRAVAGVYQDVAVGNDHALVPTVGV